MVRTGKALQSFWQQEDGAVTVDWTVLAAAIVGLGLTTVAAVRTGAVSLGADIDAALTGASVASLGDLSAGIAEEVAGWVSLYYPQDFYASLVEEYASLTAEDLSNGYAEAARTAQLLLASGNTAQASMYIDFAAVYAEALSNQGGTIPEGSATTSELLDNFNEVLATLP